MTTTPRLILALLAGPLVAALLSLGGAWWLFGRHFTAPAEIEKIVETRAPYTRDRDNIARTLASLREELARVRTGANDIRAYQNTLRQRLDIIEVKVAETTSHAHRERQQILTLIRAMCGPGESSSP